MAMYRIDEERYNLFFGEREKKIFQSLTYELMHNVAQQRIIYIAVDHEKTKPNAYGEVKNAKKIFYDPVEVYARVQVNEPQDTVSKFGLDRKLTIDVWLLLDECINEIGFSPRVGDFVMYEEYFFEIYKASDVRFRYGLEESKFETNFSAHVVRSDVFDIENIQKGGHSIIAPH